MAPRVGDRQLLSQRVHSLHATIQARQSQLERVWADAPLHMGGLAGLGPRLGPASDAELWRSWCTGNQGAGRALFERYFGPISRFFAHKVRSDHDDLVQETFASCMAGKDRLRDPERFRSYLFGVAYNVLRVYYRRHGVEDSDELASRSVHDLAPGPSTLLRGDELQRLLVQALQRLPLELQVAVELSYWESSNPSDPNPPKRRDFGTNPSGSLGVLALV